MCPTHRDTPNTTIKEAEDLEQTAALDRAQQQKEQTQELDEFRTQDIVWEDANNKTSDSTVHTIDAVCTNTQSDDYY